MSRPRMSEFPASLDDWKEKEVVPVSREEWGAMPPKLVKFMKTPSHNVIFTYHTEHKDRKFEACRTPEDCCQRMRDMQKYFIEEANKRDIPFNFLVGGDGRIYEGRGWHAKPLRNKEFPTVYGRTIEIAYIGDYHEKRPPKKMWYAAWDFCTYASENKLLDSDYEFLENYDEEKLEKIDANKPWYE